MSKKKTQQVQPDEQAVNFINDRNERLLKLMGELMPIVKKTIEEKGYSSIDIAEALSLCAASTLVGVTPPEHFERVQKEAKTISEETIKVLGARKIGMDTSIIAQILGQVKVVSYLSSYASLNVFEHSRQKEAEANAGTATDSPSEGTK